MKKPPKIPTLILRIFSHPEVDFSIAGDFEEEYYEMAANKGVKKARLWYWLHVVNSIPTFIKDSFHRSTAMFKNYIKIAVRNLLKQKVYSAINIFGLSIGIACSIMIYLFVKDEMEYDRFHENADRIFEVYSVIDAGAYRINCAPQLPLANILVNDFPEITTAARIHKSTTSVKKENTIFTERIIGTTQEFFNIFTFPLKQQLTEHPLDDLNSVIITGRMGEKYFADNNPIGKTISISINNKMEEFIVSGILDDIPQNSSMKFDFLINIKRVFGSDLNEWNDNSAGIIILLQSPDGYLQLEGKFSETLNEKYSESKSAYHLQSFVDYHLEGEYSYLLEFGSSSRYSYILSAIAVIVLLIACFNFMNLAVGRSSIRIKEIGMRKVFGARRKHLLKQFWFESYIISFIALFAGIILTLIFLPTFSTFAQKTFTSSDLFSPFSIAVCLGVTIFSGFVAGSYPAVVLSGFRPVDLFKREMKFSERNVFTKTLIFLQFCTSIVLILSTVFMFMQYRYLVQKDLGFDTEGVILVLLEEIPDHLRQSGGFYESLRGKIGQFSDVAGIGFSGSKLTSSVFGATFPTVRRTNKRALLSYTNVDEGFLETLGIGLTSGRAFSTDDQSDIGKNVLVNKAFIEKFELDSPLNTEFSKVFEDKQGANSAFTSLNIVGVTNDFNYHSLYYEIYPLYLKYAPDDGYGYMYVKIRGDEVAETIAEIKNEFENFVPDTPFVYAFFDDEIQTQYTLERRWSNIINYSAIFAIIIASSGLFGVTLLSVVRKTKEISVRKVLGSTIPDIIKLISKEFLVIVFLANIVAWPVSYYIMKTILQNYAFKISIDFWIFAITGSAAVLIAGLTISFHAVKAASMNPVDTLRSE
ncbi:MAG: FtsX-like permease family protein [bacterium]|nr:FtsX-like permease family protein [bacterium]